jgi:hypothetical protein
VFRFILPILFLCISHAFAETGTSTNLLYKEKINETEFYALKANLVTRESTDGLFFGYGDVSLGTELNVDWSTSIAYRQAHLKLGENWRVEHRPMLNLQYMHAFESGLLRNRQRFEWRFFEGDWEDRERYRNETEWTTKKQAFLWDQKFFVAEEFFVESNNRGLNQNWITLGLTNFIQKGLKWKAGYRLHSNEFSDEWQHRHVLVWGLYYFTQ